MNDLAVKSYVLFSNTCSQLPGLTHEASLAENRRDRWVTLVVIAIALVLAVGLAVA